MVLPVPVSKEQAVEHRQYSANSGNKIEAVQKVPLQIWVHGDYAYTDYYIYSTIADKSGKKESFIISRQDVLLKKDGKWLKVGSMSSAKPFN